MELLSKVDSACAQVALGAIALWLSLVVSFFVLLRSNLEPALDSERSAAGFTACALTASLIHRAIPFLFKATPSITFGGGKKPDSSKTKPRVYASPAGVMWAAFAVNGIAASTLWITFLTDVPIIVDHITGCRVHVLRWCEWAVLAFVITFMVEAIDSRNAYGVFTLASKQGLSTSCGLIFPFVSKSVTVWWTVMAVSFLLFFTLFQRYFEKRAAMSVAQEKLDAVAAATALEAANRVDSSGSKVAMRNKDRNFTSEVFMSVDEQEDIERIFAAFSILRLCCFIWTVFVTTFCLFSFESWWFRDSCLFPPSWHFVVDCFLDLGSKMIFTSIIVDSHGDLFNPSARSENRVKELQSLIGVVWEFSSDALVVTSRSVSTSEGGCGRDYIYTGTSSPTVLDMIAEGTNSQVLRDRSESVPTVQDIDYVIDSCLSEETDEQEPKLSSFSFKFTDLGSKSMDCLSPETPARYISLDSNPLTKSIEASGFFELICRAWASFDEECTTSFPGGQASEDGTLLQSIRRQNGDIAFCEAKVTRLGPQRIVMVVRDVTERTYRHEAEKRFVAESTARKMDAAANRFTRHEVKNGLLSAIGLCDTLMEKHEQSKVQVVEVPKRGSQLMPDDEPITARISELDKTLTDTLNTVLSEAMARELVHDAYVSKPENVNVDTLLRLSTSRFSSHYSFQFECVPRCLPVIIIDPHLLHCIHRNAVSNACKYGAREGNVVTRVFLDESACVLTVQVTNKAGAEHDVLRALSPEDAKSAVFSAGTRLHCDLAAAVSSGDGGWIIQKCASTLNGEASISFEDEQTIFTLKCPVQLACTSVQKTNVSSSGECEWTVPPNVWVHAVDDSKMQRKILKKIFQTIDVPDARVVISGATFAECSNFAGATEEHIRQHPDDLHLIVADENLDHQSEDSVLPTLERTSGSRAIEEILGSLKTNGLLERQVLALVRSANDCIDDIALYKSRGHGILPKEIVRRGDVLRVLEPLWQERFGAYRDS